MLEIITQTTRNLCWLLSEEESVCYYFDSLLRVVLINLDNHLDPTSRNMVQARQEGWMMMESRLSLATVLACSCHVEEIADRETWSCSCRLRALVVMTTFETMTSYAFVPHNC